MSIVYEKNVVLRLPFTIISDCDDRSKKAQNKNSCKLCLNRIIFQQNIIFNR